MISKRQKMILKAIVEEYVQTAEPVGSKILTMRPEFKLDVSPATIRNDMVLLEEFLYKQFRCFCYLFWG